jgi:hypothetical protein
MRDGAIVAFFATMQEASMEGQQWCAGGYQFSVRLVTDTPSEG